MSTDGWRELDFEPVPAVLDRLVTFAVMADGGGPPIIKFEKLIPRPDFVVLDSGLFALTSLSEPEDLEEIRELYANHFRIAFNVADFVVDFGRNFDGEAFFYQRIITAPIRRSAT